MFGCVFFHFCFFGGEVESAVSVLVVEWFSLFLSYIFSLGGVLCCLTKRNVWVCVCVCFFVFGLKRMGVKQRNE